VLTREPDLGNASGGNVVDNRPPDIVLVIGGEPVDPSMVRDLPGDAYVIAADSGIDLALTLGWNVDRGVGDFDSVTPGGLTRIIRANATIERHPAAKDATDLELALEAAARRSEHRVVAVGGGGGRADHLLANQLVLAAPRFATLEVEHRTNELVTFVVRGARRIDAVVGQLVTVVPIHGDATVSLSGASWPLDHHVLIAGTSQGVSNITAGPVDITVHDGTALVLFPTPHGAF
jgi:thiamine pyrophosphokinase